MNNRNRYYDSTKAHHTEKGFTNIDPFYISKQDVRKWKKQHKVLPPKAGYEAFANAWCQPADFTILGDQIWWLGHATSLIRIGGKVILTDPIFSERASPFTFIGPKRVTACASDIDSLPRIDITIISHNHYDHLDYWTIRQLIKRNPRMTVIVPLGLKQKMLSWGASQVIDLDWWQSTRVDGILLTSVPARHWSQRTLFDANRTLWCGWIIQNTTHTLYFVGDTGYMPEFTKIAQRFPSIDMALIPIGSYAPRWFMQNQHIDPAQALQLFKDIGCQRAIAIHWGAFELADEAVDEPPQALYALLDKETVITKDHFLVIKMGQNIAI